MAFLQYYHKKVLYFSLTYTEKKGTCMAKVSGCGKELCFARLTIQVKKNLQK